MEEDPTERGEPYGNPQRTQDAKKLSADGNCDKCKKKVRYIGTIRAGMESVKMYRCAYCGKEFVDEELRRK